MSDRLICSSQYDGFSLLIEGMFVVFGLFCGVFVLLLIIKGFLRINGVVISTCLIENLFSLHHSQTNLTRDLYIKRDKKAFILVCLVQLRYSMGSNRTEYWIPTKRFSELYV